MKPSRDHVASRIACIASQARLTEYLIQFSRGNDWEKELSGWLDEIQGHLDKARLLAFDVRQDSQNT